VHRSPVKSNVRSAGVAIPEQPRRLSAGYVSGFRSHRRRRAVIGGYWPRWAVLGRPAGSAPNVPIRVARRRRHSDVPAVVVTDEGPMCPGPAPVHRRMGVTSTTFSHRHLLRFTVARCEASAR